MNIFILFVIHRCIIFSPFRLYKNDNDLISYLGESIFLFIKIQNDCATSTVDFVKFDIELRSPKYHNILLVDGPIDSLSPLSSIHRILYHEINDLG